MHEEIDEQLVEMFLSGREDALSVLVRKYTAPLYNFTARFFGVGADAEDAVQETFIKVWKSLKKFDQKRRFKTWIYTIARNTIYDYLRKKRKLSKIDVVDQENNNLFFGDESVSLEERIDLAGRMVEIKKIIDELPIIYKSILDLHYKDGFSIIEVAEILNEPVETIKSRKRRGLLIVRVKLLK